MRREHISYMNRIPINIELLNIQDYPIHWHQSIEILMILKGSVNVTIESDTYKLIKNEIEIINLDEAHRIFSNEDNLVLLMHIDANFLQRYYDDIKNIYFYTDCSFEGEPQVGERYDLLKKYLSIILCETLEQGEDYNLYIKETLVELLYLLINEFHYLIYENKDLKDDVEQLQRYHRIAKYIYNNYNNKISLQDIAKKEFLSAHYLSNEIKNALGINFQDFVNLTRAEESVKLLLDTDMTISEISEEVGFSHTRYYNKHFKRHYKMSPTQFRKKYKLDEKKLKEKRKTEAYDLKVAQEYLISYLESYERYNYKDKIVKIHVDISQSRGEFIHNYKGTVLLPKANHILENGIYGDLKIMQEEIGFEYGQIQGLFSKEMGIYNNGMINFKKVKKIIDIILALDLRPDIIFSKTDLLPSNYKELSAYFLEYFEKQYGSYEISKWRYTIDSNIPVEVKSVLYAILKDEYGLSVKEEAVNSHDVNLVYDKADMIPGIIHQAINNKPWNKVKAIDELEEAEKPTNFVFFGDRGLLNWEGLKKPSYHAYYFLSRLGDTVVDQGDGYIITSKGEDFQILLYTHSDDIQNNFSLNITNLWRDYRVIKYEIGQDINSFDQWKAMGKPDQLTDEEMELIKLSSIPSIKLSYKKKKPVQNINLKIKGPGAVLILFTAY